MTWGILGHHLFTTFPSGRLRAIHGLMMVKWKQQRLQHRCANLVILSEPDNIYLMKRRAKNDAKSAKSFSVGKSYVTFSVPYLMFVFFFLFHVMPVVKNLINTAHTPATPPCSGFPGRLQRTGSSISVYCDVLTWVKKSVCQPSKSILSTHTCMLGCQIRKIKLKILTDNQSS